MTCTFVLSLLIQTFLPQFDNQVTLFSVPFPIHIAFMVEVLTSQHVSDINSSTEFPIHIWYIIVSNICILNRCMFVNYIRYQFFTYPIGSSISSNIDEIVNGAQDSSYSKLSALNFV